MKSLIKTDGFELEDEISSSICPFCMGFDTETESITEGYEGVKCSSCQCTHILKN